MKILNRKHREEIVHLALAIREKRRAANLRVANAAQYVLHFTRRYLQFQFEGLSANLAQDIVEIGSATIHLPGLLLELIEPVQAAGNFEVCRTFFLVTGAMHKS